MTGIFVSRGMRLSIPPGGLVIHADGTSNLSLHVRFDVCPTWCQLALRHAAEAERFAGERAVTWAGTDEDAKAAALEREFESSMQAIIAAAISIDAFYANLKDHLIVAVPTLRRSARVTQWLRRIFRSRNPRRAPRHAQIAEAIRRAFRLKKEGTAVLKNNLQQLFHFRDLAVHPSGEIQAPILHPELNVAMEWRFVFFRAQNARMAADISSAALWDLTHNGNAANAPIKDYATTLAARMDELFPNGHPLIPARAKSAK